MDFDGQCPSGLMLDEWVVGELSQVVRTSVGEHIDVCERCRQRVERRKVDVIRFAKTVPAFDDLRLAATVVSDEMDSHRPRAASVLRGARGAAAGLVAVAAGLLLWLRPGSPANDTRLAMTDGTGVEPVPPAAFETRLKGNGVALRFFVKRGDSVMPGRSGMVLRPGDGLRFSFDVPRHSYCGVWGIDAEGLVSAYFVGDELLAVSAQGGGTLPGAVALDGTLGRERLIGVVCEAPLRTSAVTRALEVDPDASLLPPGCIADVLPITKSIQ